MRTIKWRPASEFEKWIGEIRTVRVLSRCRKCWVTIHTLADIDDPDKDRLVPEFCEACGEEGA